MLREPNTSGASTSKHPPMKLAAIVLPTKIRPLHVSQELERYDVEMAAGYYYCLPRTGRVDDNTTFEYESIERTVLSFSLGQIRSDNDI